MLPEIDEKQITWGDFIEAVTEDCLQDKDLEQVEPFGPSPIQDSYITAVTLEQMRQDAKKKCLLEAYHGTFEWPEDDDVNVIQLDDEPGQVVPASFELDCGVDTAKEDAELTGVLCVDGITREDFYAALDSMNRDSIAKAFGVPVENVRVDGGAFTGTIDGLVVISGMRYHPLCGPSRNQITGDSE